MSDRDGFLVQGKTEETQTDYNSAPEAASESQNNRDFDIYHVRRVVAGNPNTPKQVLARLADDTMPGIRRRVAENPKTPPEILMRIAHDEHPDVRLAVAENPNSPPDILALLADDEDVDVRYGVAENPHMPEEILVKLSEDDNPYVRCRAMKTLQMMAPDVQSRVQLMMEPGYGGAYKQQSG